MTVSAGDPDPVRTKNAELCFKGLSWGEVQKSIVCTEFFNELMPRSCATTYGRRQGCDGPRVRVR